MINNKTARYLWDAKTAADSILEFVAGRKLEDYLDDKMLRSAVERQFAIIGEALVGLRRTSPDLAAVIADLHIGRVATGTSACASERPPWVTMTPTISDMMHASIDLCVRRLDLFGSAATGRFDPARSDLDRHDVEPGRGLSVKAPGSGASLWVAGISLPAALLRHANAYGSKLIPDDLADLWRITYFPLDCVPEKRELALVQFLEFLERKALQKSSHGVYLLRIRIDVSPTKTGQARSGGCEDFLCLGTSIAEIGRSGCVTICSSTSWKSCNRQSIAAASNSCGL